MKNLFISLMLAMFSVTALCSDSEVRFVHPEPTECIERVKEILMELSVSEESTSSMLGDLKALHHHKVPHRLYHSFKHTLLVAITAYEIASNIENISDNDKLLLVISALLHDVDPNRSLGTPPSVTRTLEYFDEDGIGFFDYLEDDYITKVKIFALILRTDFSPNPQLMGALIDKAYKYIDTNFNGTDVNPVKMKELSELLTFADKISMYTLSVDFATNAVEGLANEVSRFQGAKTFQEMLRGTKDFLKALKDDELFESMPDELKNNFKDVYNYFNRL